mmetsp:Transcript_9618/g.31466  ORF Transcript_9618/g.31466 Transcript_9618/m.31466 type:complete len:238 (-) Transcript_9618:13-726(-)
MCQCVRAVAARRLRCEALGGAVGRGHHALAAQLAHAGGQERIHESRCARRVRARITKAQGARLTQAPAASIVGGEQRAVAPRPRVALAAEELPIAATDAAQQRLRRGRDSVDDHRVPRVDDNDGRARGQSAEQRRGARNRVELLSHRVAHAAQLLPEPQQHQREVELGGRRPEQPVGRQRRGKGQNDHRRAGRLGPRQLRALVQRGARQAARRRRVSRHRTGGGAAARAAGSAGGSR